MNDVKLANAGPIGLLGFGMTTILLCLHYAGFYELGSVTLATGIFCGGFAQAIAGILEFRKGNTFAHVCFTFYGFFWLALVFTILLPSMNVGVVPASAGLMGCFLTLFAVFSFFMFIGTLKAGRTLQFVFLTLVALFAVLALANFTGNASLVLAGGYIGIVCGASAVYLACAQVLAEMYGYNILPH